MHRQLQCFGILYLLLLVACDDSHSQDEDDMNYYLDQLYKETEDSIDPHDMLANPRKKKDSAEGIKGSVSLTEGPKIDDRDSNSSDNDKLIHTQEQLSKCQEQVAELEHSVEVEQQRSSVLQKKLKDEGFIDMQAFYSRSIHHMWNVLRLEEAQHILKDGNSAILRYLVVRVTKDDLDVLQQYLKHEERVHEVDDFLQHAFKLDNRPQQDYSDFFSYVQSFVVPMKSVFEVMKNVESAMKRCRKWFTAEEIVTELKALDSESGDFLPKLGYKKIWLHILCAVFLFLALWAFYLFVRDIQQELRWGRVLGMMMVIVFFICCLWHWRHMHKVAESRRHAQMVKRGFTNIPEECKPGSRGTTGSIWEWMKVNVFGSPNVCERYFEELMIDPTQEITPAMVISETLAKFCLQPLQHIGTESAKFITNFYSNVPVVYHIPATIVFVVLLVIILFYGSGYGIDFPLWMGGIRPVYRNETTDTAEVDRITREAVAQLNRDRERFMEESRAMLNDITRAAISTQNKAAPHSASQENIQPLIVMSSGILENNLERLISQQLSNILHPVGSAEDTAMDSPPRFQGNTHIDSEVFTVTSTHREHFTSQDQAEKQASSDVVTREKNIESKALRVSTDAIHYRLKGSSRKNILPSRDTRSTSNNSLPSESSSTVSLNMLGDRQLEQVPSSSISIDAEGSTSSSPQKHISNQSVKQRDDLDIHQDSQLSRAPDEPVHEDVIDASITGIAGGFYSEVKNILEDSSNSSLNDSISETDTSASSSIRKRHNKSQNIDHQGNQVECLEEVELSSNGVKFLKTVENILTP